MYIHIICMYVYIFIYHKWMSSGGRSISTACVGPSEALWHQKQLQWPSIAEAGGTKILDIVQAWYSMSSLCGEREVSQLFALKTDEWQVFVGKQDVFLLGWYVASLGRLSTSVLCPVRMQCAGNCRRSFARTREVYFALECVTLCQYS